MKKPDRVLLPRKNASTKCKDKQMATSGRRSNGEGTIVQRADGRWMASVTVGHGPDGKQKRKSFYGKSRKEVAGKLGQALQDQKAGLVVDPKRATLAEFLDLWLEESVRQTTRPNTYIGYRGLVKNHISPKLGHVQVQKLEPLQVQHFLNERLSTGLSTRMVQFMRVVLRRALSFAVKWGYAQRNVATLVDPPRVKRPEVVPLTQDQAKQFLAHVSGGRYEALFTLTIALGLRRGEVLALKWQDVDLVAGTLAVTGTLQRLSGALQVVEPKTEKSRRVVRMPQVAILALKAHRTKQLEARLKAGTAWQDSGLVFTTLTGGPFDPRRLNRVFDVALGHAGLPHFRFHDLRHSAATLLLAGGVSVKVISEMLGHANTSITLDVYSHSLDTMRQEAADHMDTLLKHNM